MNRRQGNMQGRRRDRGNVAAKEAVHGILTEAVKTHQAGHLDEAAMVEARKRLEKARRTARSRSFLF